MRRREFLTVLSGMVATCPRAAHAQQRAVPVIGFLSTRSAAEADYVTAPFRQGLKEAGYVESQNMAIEFRWAEFQYDRLPGFAADLVQRRVAVIAAVGGIHSGLAAKRATSTIPIVFVSAGDPVSFGLVPSLSRHGSNVTGISMITVALAPKRLELLHELVPTAAVIAMLANPTSPYFEPETRDVLDAARKLGLHVHVLEAKTERDLDGAFATLGQKRAAALLVSGDPFFDSQRDKLVALAARRAVPAIYQWREFADLGGLVSYGSSITNAYREAGLYAGRILKGERPADLPIVQPTRLELVINLKTAKALGLTIPQSILVRADQVLQ
jgi:putative tryptophan/tyrosine transport system substrate-binding protein